MATKTEKIAYVVWADNRLLDAHGPVGVAFTEQDARDIQKQTEWISDSSEIVQVNIYE